MEKRISKSAVALGLAMFMLGGVAGFFAGYPLGKSASGFDFSPAADAEDGMLLGDMQDDGISMTSVAIPLSSPDIMPIAESAQQVTATVTPVDAEDAVLDWSLAWKSGASGQWGNGKDVTEYVTVTPTEDGALTANVQCLQAFGEQIILTASIRGNSSVKGTATVDYRQRYKNVSAKIIYTNSNAEANITWDLSSSDLDITLPFPGGFATTYEEFESYYTAEGSNKGTYKVTVTTWLTDVYTIAATIDKVTVNIKYSSAFTYPLTSFGFTQSSHITLNGNGQDADITDFDFKKALLIENGSDADWIAWKQKLSTTNGIKIIIQLTTTVNSVEAKRTFQIRFDKNSYGLASNVAIAPDAVEF